MIDILVQFPSQEEEIAFSKSVGLRDEDGVIVEDFYSAPWNINYIEAHSYVQDDELIEVPGYWVMLKSQTTSKIPKAIQSYVVERDPSNPAIPNRKWA